MTVTERKPGVGCDKLLMGGYHCGRPGEGLCSRCWAIQHDEDAASLRKQLEGAVEDCDHYKAALEIIAAWATGTGETARRALASAPSTIERQ